MDLTQSFQILKGSDVKNNLDLVRPLWLFSQTQCVHRDTQGGSKLTSFFIYNLSKLPVDPNIACVDPVGGGGGKGPGPPLKKHKLYGFL